MNALEHAFPVDPIGIYYLIVHIVGKICKQMLLRYTILMKREKRWKMLGGKKVLIRTDVVPSDIPL